jgi:sugar lactone lactonase YvrE
MLVDRSSVGRMGVFRGALFVLILGMAVLCVGWFLIAGSHYIAYRMGQRVVVDKGLYYPYSVAVDGHGNVYVADSRHNRVLKETPSGEGYIQSDVVVGLALSFGTALDNDSHLTEGAKRGEVDRPYGLAVDGDGDVYISDYGNDRVLKETPSGHTYTQTVVTTDVQSPYGLAVDSHGSVYIADYGRNRVTKESPSGSNYVESVVAGSGLRGPEGVAVDREGNVYIADSDNDRVLKESVLGIGYVESTLVDDMASPRGVAVDGSGNVYIVSYEDGNVYKETFSNGHYVQTRLATMVSLYYPRGIAVDGSDRLYIADSGHHRVAMQQRTQGYAWVAR